MFSIYRTIVRNAFRLAYHNSGCIGKAHHMRFLAIQNVNTRKFSDQSIGKVDEIKKLYLQFTCKKCLERNSYMISKLAYEKGVVICECRNCKNNHLIADNLKWFRDENVNIEDLLREKGETLRNKSEALEFLIEDNKAIKK